MNSLLSVRDLHKSFVEGASEIHILRGLNLELAPGERLAVVGQSGVGKSTLLHILGTLDRPTEGAILFEGDALPLDDEAALSNFAITNRLCFPVSLSIAGFLGFGKRDVPGFDSRGIGRAGQSRRGEAT